MLAARQGMDDTMNQDPKLQLGDSDSGLQIANYGIDYLGYYFVRSTSGLIWGRVVEYNEMMMGPWFEPVPYSDAQELEISIRSDHHVTWHPIPRILARSISICLSLPSSRSFGLCSANSVIRLTPASRSSQPLVGTNSKAVMYCCQHDGDTCLSPPVAIASLLGIP